MARRKKRKKKAAAFSGVLKYEIYGIVLITLAVIALSGEATVGRSLSKMFGLMLGKFYFAIPLIGIYYGLMVMIHRKWPSGWTTRKTGLVLLVFALTLMSTVSAMHQKLIPVGALEPGAVLTQIHNDMQTELLTPAAPGERDSMLNKDISGGYIGAAQFALFLWLFGSLGARLIMIVMFIISFMLITNLSYVDLIRIFRTKIWDAGSAMYKRLEARPATRAASSSAGKKSGNIRKVVPVPVVDDEEDDDDEMHDQQLPKRKSPIFFQLFGKWGSDRERMKAERELDQDDSSDTEHVVYRAEQENLADAWQDGPITACDTTAPAAVAVQSRTNSAPIIRDFFEHVRAEDASKDDDLDDAYPFPDDLTANMQGEELPIKVSDEILDTNEWAEAANAGADVMDAVDGISDVESTLSNAAQGSDTEGQEVQPVKPPPPPPKPYKLPSFRLLSKPNNGGKGGDQKDYMQTARKLEATLESFGVRAKVLEVVRGPAVTRYEIQPDIGVKVSRIVSLTDDIALALAAKDIRMEAPIPGKSAIGIEVPNGEVSVVTMREVMETATFQDAESKVTIAFGRDISGQTIIGNLARMPHLLVAGATGSGKSVCINGIITSILYKAKPDEVKFLMVDPKMVELNVYNGIPHLMAPVVTDPKRASLALKKIVVEMEKRYELFSKSGTRNVEGYNNLMKDNPAAVLPYIVVIVDELADLMMVAAGDVEDAIARLAQMARAAGIHLIIATQRPSVDVITGVIKANIPSRIAFGVSSQVDSRTILDMGGAEKLLGRGDMLFMPMGASKPVRVQGAFMSDEEVENIVNYVRGQGEAQYDESIVPEVDDSVQAADEVQDELYEQAVQIILEAKQASVSLLQRRMRVGYTRAARLIDSMEARGVIGPYEGSKPREVLISLEQYQQNKISS
ncbi:MULTISPECIES: FtsK/SpoIIIE family DNA translocase [Paenibacillus]|uniref:FtsK/SpoIIIE family DNA translocase n=1 Tax=Paenibacillus TaxID=44249 RepID=UPI00041DD79C|nr:MULTISPECIES: DNA translocase FtsK [Paenibacillus]KGP80984.1 cell division protein FtsK [Paenibacillus sp. MAEPY1]KGP82914.1 cell division protein FtsK [Paenibacillus sp. MAEPY2]OZQ73730.1 DNA translocase FtsK [Paenibacillus taichungensis]HBU84946.1 DNA translocase FtsK [Paenibacillus sp.]